MLQLIFCFLLIVNLGSSKLSVIMEEGNEQNGKVLIRCWIIRESTIKTSYKRYLNCPLQGHYCFINCKRQCTLNDDNCHKLNPITSCTFKQTPLTFVYHYTVDLVKLSKLPKEKALGNWTCTYKGIKSNSIQIKSAIPYFTTTTKHSNKPSTKEPGRKPVIIEKISKYPAFQKRSTTKSSTTSKSKNDLNKPIGSSSYRETDPKINNSGFKIDITRFEIIIIILIVLGISILVNFVFCTRECLMKVYIENLKHNENSSKGLLCCLCQSIPKPSRTLLELDRVISREDSSRFPSPSTRLMSNFTPTQSINTDNIPQSEITNASIGRSHSMSYARSQPGMQDYVQMQHYSPLSHSPSPTANSSLVNPNHFSMNHSPYYSLSRANNLPAFIPNGRQYIPIKNDQFIPIRKPISQMYYQTNMGQNGAYNPPMPQNDIDLIQNCTNINNNDNNSNNNNNNNNNNGHDSENKDE